MFVKAIWLRQAALRIANADLVPRHRHVRALSSLIHCDIYAEGRVAFLIFLKIWLMVALIHLSTCLSALLNEGQNHVLLSPPQCKLFPVVHS